MINFSYHIHTDLYNMPNLEKLKSSHLLLTSNWRIPPEKYGYPEELSVKIYTDYQGLKVNSGNIRDVNSLKIVCVCPNDNDLTKYHALLMLSFFNLLPKHQTKIYCHSSWSGELSSYSNMNIDFINNSQKEIEANIIVTFGPGTIHFLKQRVPVIVIGPYGIGGWVTPHNFYSFVENGFMGRPGGNYGEDVPMTVFMDEIISLKEKEDLSAILTKIEKISQNCSVESFSGIDSIITKASKRCDLINHATKKWDLKPIMCSHIEYFLEPSVLYIQRKYINDTLVKVDSEDAEFFLKMNKMKSFRDLYKMSGMNEENFWKMIYELFNKHIINFSECSSLK